MPLPLRAHQAADAARTEQHVLRLAPPAARGRADSAGADAVADVVRNLPTRHTVVRERNQRVARMLRECKVSAAPALLLAVACATLVGIVALNAFLG